MEAQQVKRLCRKELERNEDLTKHKQRIQNDIKNCTVQMNDYEQVKDNLERELNEMQAVIDQLNKDIQMVIGV